MSVQEIEKAIAQLSRKELAEFTSWFADYRAKHWEDQIAKDLEQGRLDSILEAVDQEYESGGARPL